MHLLPRSEWQAAPAGSAQDDDDADESDSEEPEAADAAVGQSSGAQPEYARGAQQSESALDGAMQQLQLHDTANKLVKHKPAS